MSVPESIRSVPRPKNTIVADNKRDGPYRWAVRARSGVKYKQGLKNPQPQTGKVIGHIVNGKYVPREVTNDNALIGEANPSDSNGVTEEKAYAQEENKNIEEKASNLPKPPFLEYGASVFVHSFVQDIENDLFEVFDPKTTYQIMSIASLRILQPKIPDSRLNFHYRTCFISEFYPGTALSSNTVRKLEYCLGVDEKRRNDFTRNRISKIAADHHIAIDGMLKQDTSTENNLSGFTNKSRVKGRGEISLIYAYDVETKEPICGEVFPGNFIDASAYAPFIRDNHITHGIIVDDKGFPPGNIAYVLKDCSDLHFLTPIKENDRRITTYKVLRYNSSFSFNGKNILCNKVKLPDGHFLYAYRDIRRAYGTEYAFSKKSINDGGPFNPDVYANNLPAFGSIVLESDLDMQLETAFAAYDERWELEETFRKYKSALDLDRTNKQCDFIIIGSEFINFISTLITTRMYKCIENTGKFNRYTYPDIMETLKTAWRRVDAPPPVTGDIYWVHLFNEAAWVMEQLGISQSNPNLKLKTPQKGQMKRKSDTASTDQYTATKDETIGHTESLSEEHLTNKSLTTNNESHGSAVIETPTIKRGPGRPRIHPPKDPNEPKRPVGRPRIHPAKDPNEPKRKRGRPRKYPLPEV